MIDNAILPSDPMSGAPHPREEPIVPELVTRYARAVPAREATASQPPAAAQPEPNDEPDADLAPAFADAYPDASVEEQILSEMISRGEPVLAGHTRLEALLLGRLLESIDDRRSLTLAKVLREVTASHATLSKRRAHVLGTLATLRAQRQVLDLHRGSDGV